ncbi:WD domain-containing protein [Purpureocillium lilacinum]|uniref:WD domain-containing protein n=1 Tax=Purpureocillium lilacinum TaxID=33203 RepID=A0A2U3EHE4_PURLI|nr:WD domain-containing protein [Purpureocillium lilacinum]
MGYALGHKPRQACRRPQAPSPGPAGDGLPSTTVPLPATGHGKVPGLRYLALPRLASLRKACSTHLVVAAVAVDIVAPWLPPSAARLAVVEALVRLSPPSTPAPLHTPPISRDPRQDTAVTLPPPAARAPRKPWYLLEGNYRETAAKFQKEWHVKEPHRDFDFARHVKGHALVSVVNRGLLYYALERDCILNQASGNLALAHARFPLPLTALPRDGDAVTDGEDVQLPQESTAAAESSQVGIFGPLTAPQLPPTKREEADDAAVPAGEDPDALRKRAPEQQQVPNGSPAKRPRLSNGYDNGPDAAPLATATTTTTATTPMDVDHPPHPLDDQQNQDSATNHAYPSPLEGEQLPPPVPQTEGPEQGTQVDKVEELSPVTSFIRLTDEDHGAAADTTPSPSPAGSENAPVLLQCEWNPRDPSVLAAAGTDALARVWTVSRATAPEPGHDHVSPQAHSLIDQNAPKATTVTALSWTSDGSAIAVATDTGTRCSVNIWSPDGVLGQTLDVSEGPVIKLTWNPTNTALLAIYPAKGGGAIVNVFAIPSEATITYHLPSHDIAATPLDAAWTSDSDFLLCGGDLLLCLRCVDMKIVQVRKFETKDDDSFTQVLFDWRSKLAATASDKGSLDLWDEHGQRRSIQAHQGAITTMAWQPLPPSQPEADDERLIATGGDDCAILIWNARKPEAKSKCFLTMDSPIVRLAFTPDGAFIAGATTRQVLIWKVDNFAMPRASWKRPPHPGWLSPKGSSDTDEEDEHCLCWDMSGQKLAYGSNSRLAVINFSR